MKTFHATIISGAGRGRGIGFPTLNLLSEETSSVEPGVYACRATYDESAHFGALHIGPRPTFDAPPSCEVHIIDTDVSIAPSEVTIELVEKIRDVKKFNSVEELSAQLESDVDRARAILQSL